MFWLPSSRQKCRQTVLTCGLQGWLLSNEQNTIIRTLAEKRFPPVRATNSVTEQ
ncbi:Protein of unknown function [Escherichia coli D6-117.29]|uniref:Uncharacterized protein n=2 Tax=Enterobacteriaceae TaxID=543 RepID=A0A2H4TKN1_ECOLX|nr:hypothetical protein FORC11_p0300 [Shigella sonnei]ATZ30103.1 hypothetical protein CV83915_2p0100 [Escherichia coli]QEO73486.1 hypothetical protein [Salmonella enterica subsp. enterica serovar Typhimurium]CDP78623.1 Protein of unknown function [Escherichia coli D6-117.29]AUO60132.1 hypothetical protein CV83906_1p103 [Escherichia coli]